jgi:hypothetical protein
VQSLRLVLPLAFALLTPCAACDSGPPIKTASGERIGSLSYEEKFPLSNDGHDSTFHGDRLRSAVAMMDRAGAISLSGDYAARGVLDNRTHTVTVTTLATLER